VIWRIARCYGLQTWIGGLGVESSWGSGERAIGRGEPGRFGKSGSGNGARWPGARRGPLSTGWVFAWRKHGRCSAILASRVRGGWDRRLLRPRKSGRAGGGARRGGWSGLRSAAGWRKAASIRAAQGPVRGPSRVVSGLKPGSREMGTSKRASGGTQKAPFCLPKAPSGPNRAEGAGKAGFITPELPVSYETANRNFAVSSMGG
jgi:hypothetical protein